MITIVQSPLDTLPPAEEIVQALEDLERDGKRLRQLLRLVRDRQTDAREKGRRGIAPAPGGADYVA